MASIEDVLCMPWSALLKQPNPLYKPYVAELITRITKEVLIPAAYKALKPLTLDGCSYYSHGLDTFNWLQGPEEAQPPVEYLASIPISFPLIRLTQLVQYLVSTASRRGRSAHLYIASQVIPRALYPLSFLPHRRRKSRSFRTRLKLPSGFSTLVCTGRKLFLSSHLNRASHKMLLKVVRVTRRHPGLPSRASRILPWSPTLPRPMLNCSSDCKTMQMLP